MTIHDRGATRRLALVAAVALAAVLAVGCGSDEKERPSGSPTTEVDATTAPDEATASEETDAAPADGECALLTEAEAEAVAGRALEEGSSTTSEGPQGTIASCVFLLAEGGAATTIVNVVLLGTEFTREQFDAQMAEDAPEGTPVDGIGEVAVLVQPGVLAVFHDGKVLNVQAMVERQPLPTEVLVELGQQALDRT